MSSTTGTTAAKKPVGRWFGQHRVLSFFLISVVLFAVAAGYFISTGVSGIEMHPVDWRVRRFWFRRDPFTNARFTGIHYSPVRVSGIWTAAASDDYSSVEGSISALFNRTGGSTEWDLVKIDDGVESIGPAIVWFELLQAYTSGYGLHWVEWTGKTRKKQRFFGLQFRI